MIFSQFLFGFSIDKVPKVTSPVLVIHGKEDEVVDFSHGKAIYEKCPRPVDPLWVEVSIVLTYDWFHKSFRSGVPFVSLCH